MNNGGIEWNWSLSSPSFWLIPCSTNYQRIIVASLGGSLETGKVRTGKLLAIVVKNMQM